jgi:hypothetical protein
MRAVRQSTLTLAHNDKTSSNTRAKQHSPSRHLSVDIHLLKSLISVAFSPGSSIPGAAAPPSAEDSVTPPLTTTAATAVVAPTGLISLLLLLRLLLVVSTENGTLNEANNFDTALSSDGTRRSDIRSSSKDDLPPNNNEREHSKIVCFRS